MNREDKKQAALGYVFLLPSLVMFAVFMFYLLRFEGQAFSMLFKGNDKLLKFFTVQKAVFASIVNRNKFKGYIESQLKGEIKHI